MIDSLITIIPSIRLVEIVGIWVYHIFPIGNLILESRFSFSRHVFSQKKGVT